MKKKSISNEKIIKFKYDIIIVGAGISGLVLAEDMQMF